MTHLADNAMIDDNGQVFFPDSPDDALYLHAEHGARPASDRFPWPCASTSHYLAYMEQLADVHVHTQCILVGGHGGDHRGEVAW